MGLIFVVVTKLSIFVKIRGGSRSWQGEGHKQAKLVGGSGEPDSLI